MTDYYDKVWKDYPMPEDYTCGCGLEVHPSVRNKKAIHIKDCPYHPDNGGEMTDHKVLNEYDLKIKHYGGDQTLDELHRPCEKCLFMYSDFATNQITCRIYLKPVRECLRMCISNYRVDIDTLVESMWRKLGEDNKKWNDWIASYPEYMNEDDGKLYVLEKPDDIVKVAKDLEDMCGD